MLLRSNNKRNKGDRERDEGPKNTHKRRDSELIQSDENDGNENGMCHGGIYYNTG